MIALRSSATCWIAAAVAVAFAAFVALRPCAPAQEAPDVAAAVDARDAVETHASAGAARPDHGGCSYTVTGERLAKLRAEYETLQRARRAYERENQNDMLIDRPR